VNIDVARVPELLEVRGKESSESVVSGVDAVLARDRRVALPSPCSTYQGCRKVLGASQNSEVEPKAFRF